MKVTRQVRSPTWLTPMLWRARHDSGRPSVAHHAHRHRLARWRACSVSAA